MKYLRRGIWFFASRLFALCLVLGLILTIFYYAMNVSNIQIILKDGMANRVKVVMGISENAGELTRYFQQAYLDADPLLTAAAQGGSAYRDYNVRGIDHRLEMGFLWLWPWENTVRVTIEERVPRIDGRVKGLRADEVIAQNGADALYPPPWPDATYRALLVRESGQWKIKNLVAQSAP